MTDYVRQLTAESAHTLNLSGELYQALFNLANSVDALLACASRSTPHPVFSNGEIYRSLRSQLEIFSGVFLNGTFPQIMIESMWQEVGRLKELS